MSENNLFIMEKSEAFSIRIVKMYKYLVGNQSEAVMSKQLLRSGTSIGANIAEAQEAISVPDFISKIYISLKETSETLYWLRLLYKSDYISESQYQSMYNDAEELKRLLTSSIKTAKMNQVQK